MVTAKKTEVKNNKNTNKNNKSEVKENINKNINKNNNKNNKNKKSEVKDKSNKNKSKPDVKHTNIDANDDDKGPLDEKGNPLPIENPEGGDPICTGGYKIDYQFDPMNDPINPPFRCIPSLKDPTDGLAGKALAMMNNPSSGIQDMAMGNLPGVGGRRGRKTIRRKKRNGIFNTRRHRHRHTRHRRG